MFTVQLANGETIEIDKHNARAFEVLLGESVSVTPTNATVTQTAGASAAVEGQTITPAEVGLGRYLLTVPGGDRVALLLFTCDPGCIGRLATSMQMHRGNGGGEAVTDARARRALRSIAVHAAREEIAWFTGSASSLDNQPLASFGA